MPARRMPVTLEHSAKACALPRHGRQFIGSGHPRKSSVIIGHRGRRASECNKHRFCFTLQ